MSERREELNEPELGENPPQDGSVAPTEDDSFGILDVFILLARRKLFILVFAVTAATVASLILKATPDTYRAQSTFTVRQKSQWDLDAFIVVNSGTGSIANQAYGIKANPILYTDIMKTSAIGRRVCRAIGIPEAELQDWEAKIQKIVSIESTEEGVITVTVDDSDPERAAAIANHFRHAIEDKSVEVNREELKRYEEFLSAAAARAKVELDGMEVRYAEELAAASLIDPGQQGKATIDLDLSLRQRLAEATQRRAQLLVNNTEKSWEVQEVEEEIRSIKRSLESLTRSEDGNDTVGYGALPEKRRRQEELMSELKQQRDAYNLLQQQQKLCLLRLDQPQSSIVPLEDAEVPMKPVWPNRGVLTVVAAIAGFGIAALLSICLEGMSRAKRSSGNREKVRALVDNLKPWKSKVKAP